MLVCKKIEITGRLVNYEYWTYRTQFQKETDAEFMMGALIEQNQMDLVIYLREPLAPQKHDPDVKRIFHLCDTHNIPLATNLATAEMVIKSLDRGELDWREMYK